ncbi:MAG: hypothetical protein AAF718_12720 [Pseudomonadota bacterium]
MRNSFLFLLCVAFYLLVAAFVGLGFDFDATLSISKQEASASVCAEPVVPLQCRDLPLTMQSPPEDYLVFFGPSDAGSYVRGAIDLVETDAPLKVWSRSGYGTWPPGMFFLNGSALVLNVPIGVMQWLFAASLWSIALSLAGLSIARRFDNRLWMLAPLPVLFLPLFATNFLHYGIVMSESSSSALFMIGLLLLAFPVPFGRAKYWVWFLSGIVFAAAVMMRAQVLYIALFAMLGFVTLTLVALVSRRFVSSWRRPAVGFFVGFFCGMLPWMEANGRLYSVDYAYSLPFIVAEYPNAGERNWLALGGIRSACIVDEQRCEEIRTSFEAGGVSYHEMRSEILTSFFTHPGDFISHKLPILVTYFMADNAYPAATVYKSMSMENVIYLAIFTLSLIYLASKRDVNSFGVAVLLLLLLFSIVGPPFAIHYEVRYLYLAKVLMLTSPLLVLGRKDLFCLRR